MIPAHQLGVGEDMTAHRAIRVCSCRSGPQLELLVERIQPEIVAMCRPGRWARTAVACSSEIVTSLPRTGRERAVRRNTCRQFALGWRQIVEHPVDPCPAGRIRIVQNQGKALCTLRRSGPTERGRHVRSVACVLRGDVGPWRERRRRQLQRHGTLFITSAVPRMARVPYSSRPRGEERPSRLCGRGHGSSPVLRLRD